MANPSMPMPPIPAFTSCAAGGTDQSGSGILPLIVRG